MKTLRFLGVHGMCILAVGCFVVAVTAAKVLHGKYIIGLIEVLHLFIVRSCNLFKEK